VGVGQCERVDEVFVPGNETIADRGVHQRTRSVELEARKVRTVGEDVSRPLVVDLSCPVRLNHVAMLPDNGYPYEIVAQRGRVQHTGVVNGPEHRHAQYPILRSCACAASSSIAWR